MSFTHERLKKFVHNKEFCHAVNYSIIGFAIVVGIETLDFDNRWIGLFNITEYMFVVFFSIEILLRILAEEHPLDFFNILKSKKIIVQGRKKTEFEITEHGVWNYFDFILIVMSLFGLFAKMAIFPGFFQIGRLFRIFRIVRLLEISDQLKEVEKKIVSIIPTVFSFAGLLLILTYIYAIIGMFMFEKKVYATADFSSIIDSFITLFQVMTLDNWSDVMKDLSVHVDSFSPIVIKLYFISFVIFTAIIAFNVFIAVMTSNVQERLEKGIAEKINAVENINQNVQLNDSLQQVILEIKNLKVDIAEFRRKFPS